MLKLKDRVEARKHRDAVNAGAVKDPVIATGRDANGEVIGKDGKPVPGTAAKGFTPDTAEKQDSTPSTEPVDYSKLRTHDDLDAALGEREKPEGWVDMKVDEKQAWLTKNPANPAGGGWN